MSVTAAAENPGARRRAVAYGGAMSVMSPAAASSEPCSFDVHRAALTALLRRAGGPRARGRTETIPISAALGRLPAEGIRTTDPLPRFDDSQMDGFAVRSADTPGRLRLAATIPAGGTGGRLVPGTAAPIMTGAPIPDGADAVVPVEDTAAGSFAALEDSAPTAVDVPSAAAGTCIRARGSDAAAGAALIPAGTRLTAAGVAAAASLGLTEVTVLARPRAVVLTGGDEVLAPGDALGPGQVYDANGALLTAWLPRRGVEVLAHRLIDDSPERLAARLTQDLRELQPDLVLTSGGISAGRFEVVRQGLTALPGAEVSFGAVAMQPGGPQGLGTVRLAEAAAAVVCLPGNPVSTWVTCETLLADALAEAWTLAAPAPWQPVKLERALTPLPAKDQIRRGTLVERQGQTVVAVFEGTSSHLLATAAGATVLVRVPAGEQRRPAGHTVAVRAVQT